MRFIPAIMVLLAACGVLLPACGDQREGTSAPETGGLHPVPPAEGKADNYVSSNAREFDLIGTAHATLPEGFDAMDDEAKAAAITSVVRIRMSSVARSLKYHVTDIIRASNGGVSGEDASWFTYFKRDSAETGEPVLLGDGRVTVPFQVELIGSVYLMSQLSPGTTGRRTFSFIVRNYSGSSEETIEVEVRGSESRDAFPKYDELFADGVFDIGLHLGGDYNEGRHDLETAKWTVEYLLESGWQNTSVTSFENLAIDSPPFTREILLEDETLTAAVYVYHAGLDGPDATADQTLLRRAIEKSMAERDIIIYSGHAGSGAGFILDYHPRYQIAASEFADLPMSDKYQIFVLDGCNTYRTYVDDLLKNPAKTFENVDIITTVNTTPFSVGYQVIHEFLNWFTLTDSEGRHFPISWKALLRGVNSREFADVHYGVHGVDFDPGLNPRASEGVACSPCTTDADCQAGGNYCLGYEAGGACGVACTHDTACGEGYRCARLFTDPDLWYLPKQCIRRDYTCP